MKAKKEIKGVRDDAVVVRIGAILVVICVCLGTALIDSVAATAGMGLTILPGIAAVYAIAGLSAGCWLLIGAVCLFTAAIVYRPRCIRSIRGIRKGMIDLKGAEGADVTVPAIIGIAVLCLTISSCAAMTGITAVATGSWTMGFMGLIALATAFVVSVALVLKRKWYKGVGPPGNARSFVLAIAYCCVLSKPYAQPKDDEGHMMGVSLSRCAIIADGFPNKTLYTNSVA